MKHFLAILIPFLLLIIGCKNSSNPVNPSNGGDKITTGDVVNLTTQSIGTDGGTIKVSKPGDPLDGFEMIIPSNSFSQSVSFQISYAPIVKHQFGENFNPISSMIKISCDESFSNHPIEIKIPIKLPAGHFAAGIFYNENTKELEAIPSIDLNDSSITLITNTLSLNKTLGKLTIGEAQINVIICSIIESLLGNGAVISTGFKPGYDDWEFPASSSYICPGGFALGQSMSAIYYYYEKTLEGSNSLYHNFDVINDNSNPPKLWQDNPRGIRLASVMKSDIVPFSEDLKTVIQSQLYNQKLVWKLCFIQILITGKPQILFLYSSLAETAHEVIVYKVNLTENKLYVADSFYPAEVRSIASNNGILEPYTSKNLFGNEIEYGIFGFVGASAMVPWKKLTERYNQFEAGTIGNGIFPSYKLYVESTSGLELTDGMTLTNPTLKIVCKSDQCESFIENTDKLQPIAIFNKDGDPIADGDFSNKGIASINLNQGENKFGIYIQGLASDGKGYYVDFKWITVNYTPATQSIIVITPNPLNGVPNTPYSFTAQGNFQWPSQYKCIWNFADNTGDVTVQNLYSVQHTFTEEGNYNVKCDLYDNATNTLKATGTSQANILSAILANVLASTTVDVQLLADFQSSNPNVWIGNNIQLGNSMAKSYINSKLNWNGLSFSCNYTYKTAPSTGTDSIVYTGSDSGTVSSDGKTILTLSASERQELKSGTGDWIEKTLKITGLPYFVSTEAGTSYRNSGPTVANNVATATMTRWTKDPSTGQYVTVTIASINYNSTTTNPNLYIIMNK